MCRPLVSSKSLSNQSEHIKVTQGKARNDEGKGSKSALGVRMRYLELQICGQKKH